MTIYTNFKCYNLHKKMYLMIIVSYDVKGICEFF